MAKDSKVVYGASGKTNVLNFVPEKLHLITDKTHPLYDERIHLPIDEGMVLNIKELGVLEPITVWKDPENGLTCVVAGRQRVRHTLEANKLLLKEGKKPLLVPAVVKRGSANQMAKYMVSENEIRRPDTPLGRASGKKSPCTAIPAFITSNLLKARCWLLPAIRTKAAGRLVLARSMKKRRFRHGRLHSVSMSAAIASS